MTFSLLANNKLKVDGNQISFGIVDFQPHPPTLTLVFTSLDQEMDLTFGNLNFRVGSLGAIHLSDPTTSGPLAEKTVSTVISDSSVGSSSEVNSSVSFTLTKTTECTIEELDEIMENLDLGEMSGHSDKGSSENFGKGTITEITTRDGGRCLRQQQEHVEIIREVHQQHTPSIFTIKWESVTVVGSKTCLTYIIERILTI
jgi:hypothetical protein